MGKQSRMKRQPSAIQAAFSSTHGDTYTGPALMVLANPPGKSDAQVMHELSEALKIEAFNRNADRLNTLPLGHPDNVEKIGKTFGPIERWMRTMQKTGDIDVMEDSGLAVFQPEPGEDWYPIVESFLAMCDTYELIALEQGIEDGTSGIRALARKINASELVDQHDIAAARQAVEWMKEVTKPLTPSQFSDYTGAIQTRATMAEMSIC